MTHAFTETAPFCLVYRPDLGVVEYVCLTCTMLDSSELGNNGELGDMHFQSSVTL